MTRPGYEGNDCRITIRPHLRIGWQTTADQVHQEVTMQLRLFCVGLPIKLRIPYSQVADVAAESREGWWSRVGAAGDFHAEVMGEHPQMPTRGWRHDILMTLRGGKTVKIKTVNSLGAAREVEQQLRHRLGLPEVH